MDWIKLRTRVANDSCVPIIGAGASYEYVPLAAEMAKGLLEEDREETKKDYPLKDIEDLAKVAQYLAVSHRDSMHAKFKIASAVQKHSGVAGELPEDDPHVALAELNLPIYITTNYDNRMQLALTQQGKTAVESVICRWNDELLKEESSPFDEGYEPTRENPVVFHLHGKMDKPTSLVASEDDYLDFLVGMAKGLASQKIEAGSKSARYMLPPPIQRSLANKLLLFVGYGVADVNFRVILRLLKTTLRSRGVTSLTVQYQKEASAELKEYLQHYFQWTLDLDMFWGTATDFAKQLRAHLRATRD